MVMGLLNNALSHMFTLSQNALTYSLGSQTSPKVLSTNFWLSVLLELAAVITQLVPPTKHKLTYVVLLCFSFSNKVLPGHGTVDFSGAVHVSRHALQQASLIGVTLHSAHPALQSVARDSLEVGAVAPYATSQLLQGTDKWCEVSFLL